MPQIRECVGEVYRIDRGERIEPRIDSRTGYLRVDARLTRVGVFNYVLPDGSVRRELRAPEQVFHADSIASLRAVPVTNEHPEAKLSAKNAAKFAKGSIGERVDVEDPYLKAAVSVWDEATIADVKAGKQEVSCGYTCDVALEPGTWRGIRYDAKQTDIRYNHVAITRHGRAGANVRLRMDSEAETISDIPVGEIVADVERKDSAMAETDTTTKTEAKTDADQIGAGAAGIFKLQARNDALAEENARLKAQLEAQEKGKGEAEVKIQERANQRAKLIVTAQRLAPDVKADALEDTAIMREVLLARADANQREALKDKLDAGGAQYTAARFDHLLETEGTRVDSAQKLMDAARRGKDAAAAASTEERTDSQKARDEMIARYSKREASA